MWLGWETFCGSQYLSQGHFSLIGITSSRKLFEDMKENYWRFQVLKNCCLALSCQLGAILGTQNRLTHLTWLLTLAGKEGNVENSIFHDWKCLSKTVKTWWTFTQIQATALNNSSASLSNSFAITTIQVRKLWTAGIFYPTLLQHDWAHGCQENQN